MARACHCHENPSPKSKAAQRVERATMGLITRAYEMLEEGRIPPQWLPKITDMQLRPGKMGTVSAHIPRYGCGSYGCVFPTLDPNVVLKVTEDDTEAEFAGNWAHRIVRPITVVYHEVLAVDPKLTKYPTFLMWREAASHVGDLQTMVDHGDQAYRLVNIQHQAAQKAYELLQDETGDVTDDDIRAAMEDWLGTCDMLAMQPEVPELHEIGAGMAEVYRENKVFFGDIHIGNLGLVTRSGEDHWVITDPGHVAVIDI